MHLFDDKLRLRIINDVNVIIYYFQEIIKKISFHL